jgi:hypothetical protein
MSHYVNFTRAFPKHCLDLLKDHHPVRWTDPEITLLLALATAGLTFPNEQFDHKNHHTPFNDWKRFPKAQTKFIRLMVEKFCGSVLLPEYPMTWTFGPLTTFSEDPITWTELELPAALPNEMTVYDLIKHLRNSLANGNVYTQDASITKIIFIAVARKDAGGLNYLTVGPDDFHTFLCRWFEFLNTLEFPK